MRDFLEFWQDYTWTVFADPLQHFITGLLTLAGAAGAVGLAWVFWAVIRGVL